MRIQNNQNLQKKKNIITFYFENKKMEGLEGDTIASALIANGVFVFSYGRKTNRPRGYSCSTDFCDGSCQMTVDGIENVKTCSRRLEPEMKVFRKKVTHHEKL
ncbi:(2Fe-2S)-binding protein [Acholeplasma equirhinis]|uniref:(2Fe-2S)-binding protein n=1 Tax=Acholeplasma equirhinis TaxID=555393 RepID=UPI00197AEF7F|nr:(2Fe-2S)-binding protein [Acholeplasma equirhinis]MBN3490262.1 (2Fe-2S)-binding protein [Acholeplasma equirhinis]